MKKDNETDSFSYRGWLTSDFFIKRLLAVMGYVLVGNLLFLIAWFTLVTTLLMLIGVYQ